MYSYKGIPSMTSPPVTEFLEQVGRDWTGQGVAMELGCWMGSTSAALLTGLVEAGYDRTYWAFDKWRATNNETKKAAEMGIKIKMRDNLLPFFLKNVTPIYKGVRPVQGLVPGTLVSYDKSPIEICLFDAPKRNDDILGSLKYLMPYFIPGVTVVGLMDFHFYSRKTKEDQKRFMAPMEFTSQHSDSFELMHDFGMEVFFKYMNHAVDS